MQRAPAGLTPSATLGHLVLLLLLLGTGVGLTLAANSTTPPRAMTARTATPGKATPSTATPSTATPSTATRSTKAPLPAGPLPGSVTCSSVEQAGSAAALPAPALRALQPQQAISCIALLGKDPLSEDQARAVWDRVLQAYEAADMVPEETLRLLGWVSAGIPAAHLVNLSLSEIATVTTMGTFHNLSLEQLTALAETVRFQWSAKEPEDFSYLDLAALNHILCGFNASDIAHVHADSYKEAASSLSLLRCPGTPGAAEVPWTVTTPGVDATLPSLRALASLAESGDAFGDPGLWTASTVGAIGCVLVGLPNTTIARIPSASLHAMLQALAGREQPVIRRCLYGSPVIAQRLASTDQTQQVVTSTANPTTISPNVTIKTVNNSFAWEGSERNASIDLKHRLGGGSRRGRLSDPLLVVSVMAHIASNVKSQRGR